MVKLTSISLALVLVAVGAFIYGTIRIATYAFRVSTGHGIAALLFPPYTVFFAFTGLDEEGKETPVAAWFFGLVVGAVLIALFFQPLSLLVTGQLDALRARSPEGAATAEADESPEPESVPAEESESGSDEGDSGGAADEGDSENDEGDSEAEANDGESEGEEG
jgi:hypothetical protein